MNRQYFTLKVPRTFIHNTQDLREWLNAYFEKERKFEGPWNAWDIPNISGNASKSTESNLYYDVTVDLYYLELK